MSKTTPTVSTSVYQTHRGIFSLTWSFSSFRRRTLHLSHLSHLPSLSPSPPLSSLHLHFPPFFFLKNSGSKRLGPNIRVFWDFSRAKFGSRPEPELGFYVAAVISGEMAFLAGDSAEQAFSKTKAQKGQNDGQIMVLRREHVSGNKIYSTKAQFGSDTRDISIDCRDGDDPRLYFSFDQKRVLQVKNLRWKFRGNERIQVDGVYIQVSWDVYNWLFEDDDQEGYGLFMFRFEKQGSENGVYNDGVSLSNLRNGLLFESQEYCGLEFEKKKMKKRVMRNTRSASSSSLSSASSCSSVMEWESVEENELKGPSDFSLLVYAWKS